MVLEKRLFNVNGYSIFNDHGGQGVIYSAPNNKLIKIYPESNEVSDRLEKIRNHGEIYRGIEDFCAVPEVMMTSSSGKVIGFQMKRFDGYKPIGVLNDQTFCFENRINIRKSVIIYLTLHRLLEQIHNNGFFIIDFNEDNVMFKLIDNKPQIIFVDIDSWAFKNPDFKLTPTNWTDGFCHPELEHSYNRDNLQPHYDWYSFAIFLASSLIRNNPFNLGIVDERHLQGFTRHKKGISCWDKRVEMSKVDAIYARRFGIELTNTLHSWLSGNQKGIFPKKVLHTFLDGLVICRGNYKGKQCNLEVHIDQANCPKCGTALPIPKPRVTNNSYQKHQNNVPPRNNHQHENTGIVGKLITNNTR